VITDVLNELGIEYRIVGKEAIAACPFHSPDRHPSWSVNVRTGLHNCFACGARGNLASLVSHTNRITYTEAVIWVNTKVGWAKAGKWREDYEVKSFAPDYLKISEADLALFTDPPDKQLMSKRITLSSAKRFGVRWNPLKNSWIFPIREPYTNELWGWQEKNERIFRNYPGGTRKSKTLFGLSAFEHDSPVVLVESPVDAVRFDATGIRGGLSSWGVQVSDFQLTLVQQRTERVVLALDNDSAGVSETIRLCSDAKGFVRQLRVFNYGESVGKDPGELDDDSIRWGIENAIPSIRYIKEKKR
jgi:DNA primase